jgi:thiamine-phosphate pyrophosphorylase
MWRPALNGLYAVTPDEADTSQLVERVADALAGGVRLIQYRNKTARPARRLEQARALRSVCTQVGARLIVNDHVDLARSVDADGVHVGAEDAGLEEARAALGPDKIVGVSCYNRLELARAAEARGADYVAFGSFFPSSVKPQAVRAPIELLQQARSELRVPIVAIGGITLDVAPRLIAAGADALAVISALFDATDISKAAVDFSALFRAPE